MKSKYTDILIIGGGPAGLSAAISCKNSFPGQSVALIEKSAPFNKIGCVIRDKTIQCLDELNIQKESLGNIYQFDTNYIYSIERRSLEEALLKKALSLGVEVIEDIVTEIKGTESSLLSVKLRKNGYFKAGFYIDATGQVALIPKTLGLRLRSGPEYKAIYTHLISDKLIEPIKNRITGNGFLWLIPLPEGSNKRKFKYQIMQVLKEGSEVITEQNLLKLTPELVDLGIAHDSFVLDPCEVFERHVRQHPPFIFENKVSQGKNWVAIGDADSTYFDKIFAGIDKAIIDGIQMPNIIESL